MIGFKSFNEMSSKSLYVVRGKTRGESDSYILGIYFTEKYAKDRIVAVKKDDPDLTTWYTEVWDVGPNGVDMFLSDEYKRSTSRRS